MLKTIRSDSKKWLLIPLCIVGLTVALASNFLLKKEGAWFWVGMGLSLIGLIFSSLIFSYKINGLKKIFSIVTPLIASLFVGISVGSIYVGTYNHSDKFMYWWLTNIVGIGGGVAFYTMVIILLLIIPLHNKFKIWSKPQKSDFIDLLLFIVYLGAICFALLATWWYRSNTSSYSWIAITFLIPLVQAIIFICLRSRVDLENE